MGYTLSSYPFKRKKRAYEKCTDEKCTDEKCTDRPDVSVKPQRKLCPVLVHPIGLCCRLRGDKRDYEARNLGQRDYSHTVPRRSPFYVPAGGDRFKRWASPREVPDWGPKYVKLIDETIPADCHTN